MKLRIGGKSSVGCGKNRCRRFTSIFLTPNDQRPTTIRRGFTLLEVLLAMMLGMLLMSALYFAFDMSIQQVQSTRDAVDIEDASRAVFNKISKDLSGILGPAPPKSGGTPTSGSSTTSTTTTTTTTNTTTTMTPTGTSSATNSQMQSSTNTTGSTTGSTQSTTTPLMPFQVGVVGPDNTQFSIFASRVPNVLVKPGGLAQVPDTTTPQPSDLYRIDYWLAQSGGLCRRERPWVTSDTVGGTDSDIDRTNEDAAVIAQNVSNLFVEYLDSTGTDAGSWDPTTQTAPRQALRVTLTFDTPNPRGGDSIKKSIAQLIIIRATPGSAVPELVDPVQSSGSTSSSSSSNSSSSGGSGGSTPAGGGGAGGGGAAGGGGGAVGGATGGGGGGKGGGGGAAGGGGGGKGGGKTGGG